MTYSIGENQSCEAKGKIRQSQPLVGQDANSEKVPVTTSAKEGAVFESILPQQKKGKDDVTSLEF